MRPTTSATTISDATTNNLFSFEPNTLTGEDCRYLLRSLEKQAFEHVFYAFRAQGPLTQYKELLLEHIKSALFISDEDFILHARIAANNPYLSKIAQELNPSYDNFSEWIAAGYDLTGVDLAKARRHALDRHTTQFATNVNQILKEIHRHNTSLEYESNQLAELTRIPKRPFVPERLRRFLQDTESSIHQRIDILSASEVITAANESAEPKTAKKAVKIGVGRPRKNSTPKNPTNLMKQIGVDNGLMPCSSSQLSSFSSKTTIVDNNSRRTKPTIPLDLSNAKSPEEQAVLAILAQSSAQISQQEAFEQQMREQMAATSSTTTTAMESLMEVALAQAQLEVMPVQNSPKVLPQIPSKSAIPLSQQIESHIEKNGPVSLIDSHSLHKPPCEEIANKNKKNLKENASIDNIKNQTSLSIGAILKPRRKRSIKQLEEKGFSCARVRPFLFEVPLDGKQKPLRGNPDKIVQPPMKRPNSRQSSDYAFGNDALIVNNISHQSYYSQFHQNSKYYNNQSTQLRVLPPNSVGYEPNTFMIDLSKGQQSTFQESANQSTNVQHYPTSTNSPIQVNNDHCYNEQTIPPSATIVHSIVENHSIPTEIIVMNAMPDAMSAGNNKCNEQNGAPISNGLSASGQIHVIDSSIPSCSNKNGQQNQRLAENDTDVPKEPIYMASTQNNVPEESGLDFLASTASLLAPIEANFKNREQQLQ